jgi:3-oxoacyl-[acyl-carrier-protein] synthase-3
MAEDFFRYAERSAFETKADSTVAALRRVWDDPFRGAVERRVLAPEHESSDMEVAACIDAMRSANVRPEDVDLLIGYSQVPDEANPGNHGRVAHRLGLNLETAAFTLDAGCASFLPQLTTAVRSIQAGDQTRALIYQSTLSSRIMDYETPSSPSLGDGAVAAVVGRVEDDLGMVDRVQLTRGELHGGIVFGRPKSNVRWYEMPESGEALTTMSRNPEHARRMGADGPEFCRDTCTILLRRHGLTPDDIDFFVCAQSAAWWADALASAVGIGSERYLSAEEHYKKYGHLLAASVSLNLWLAWTTGRLHSGDLVLLYTPGAGFTQTATLLRWALS